MRFLNRLFLAGVSSISLMLNGGPLPAFAAIGYLIYKKTKSSSSNSCTNTAAICCNINGTLTQLSSGCCADASGSDTGFTTCPGAMYLEGETTASAVSESSTTSSTATTSTSAATQ